MQFLRACVIFCYTHYLYLSMPLKTVWRDLFARYGPLETPKLLSTPIPDNNNNLYLLSFLNNAGALVVLNSLWIFSRDLHFFSQYSPAICHPILLAHPTRPASSPIQLPHGIFSTKKVSPEGLAFHIAWVYRLPSGWGSHRWLRKGDSALTPWIAQKKRDSAPDADNADEGKLASLETGLCLPAAVLVLRVFLWPCSVSSATSPRIRLL